MCCHELHCLNAALKDNKTSDLKWLERLLYFIIYAHNDEIIFVLINANQQGMRVGKLVVNTIQYNTIQYNTIQYNTIQYNTIQYNTIQYNTIQNAIYISSNVQNIFYFLVFFIFLPDSSNFK